MILELSDYASLLINDTPFIDVRAPIEFSTGTMPSATNLPLLDNEERASVGTCYKMHGQKAAIELGNRLVSGSNRDNKIKAWEAFYETHPNCVIYCARGGLRSKITQQWLRERGIQIPRVHIGYKALRRFLIDLIASSLSNPMLIVSGNTGSGKTELLHYFKNAIDLEGFANHRGSAFGRNVTEQPSQANFENQLAITLLKGIHQQYPYWLIEDEGHTLGKNHLPEGFYDKMATQPLVIIDESMESRVTRITNEYVVLMHNSFVEMFGEELGNIRYEHYLLNSLTTLQKRLGLERFNSLLSIMKKAIFLQITQNNIELHRNWIETILKEYYDPMYQYQIEKKQSRVIFRGPFKETQDFINTYTPSIQ